MNISQHLKNAGEILRESGVAEPRREAGSLLSFALDKNQTFLIAHDNEELSDAEETRFRDFIERRASREPFQYITGRQNFYGLDFVVSKDVLIPRPETELLVGTAIEILKESARFCEIGVGSGCISVTILHELKTTNAVALDISEKVMAVARLNAEKHKVVERLELRISDVYEQLNGEKFDLIVSNPPYIAAEEMKTLQIEVRDYEPATALTDGANGLSIIEKIITDAPRYLIENGFLLLEIGHLQAVEVKAMLDKTIWCKVESLPDFQGIERIIKAQRI